MNAQRVWENLWLCGSVATRLLGSCEWILVWDNFWHAARKFAPSIKIKTIPWSFYFVCAFYPSPTRIAKIVSLCQMNIENLAGHWPGATSTCSLSNCKQTNRWYNSTPHLHDGYICVFLSPADQPAPKLVDEKSHGAREEQEAPPECEAQSYSV